MNDDVLQELRSVGRVESTGRFRLDPAVALEKLGRFRLHDEHEYVLALVQAAVRSGATRLEAWDDLQGIHLRFDGEPFSREELSELFDHLLHRDARPAVLDLAVGVHSATAMRPRRITVQSGGVRLELEGGASRVSAADPRPGTVFTLLEGWNVSRFVKIRRELELLTDRARFAPLDLKVAGQRVSPPVSLPNALAVRLLQAPGTAEARLELAHGESATAVPSPGPFEAVLALSSEANQKLELVIAGVTWPFPGVLLEWPELRGLVAAPGLRLDLSRTRVVADAEFDRLRKLLSEHALRMLAEVAKERHLLRREQSVLLERLARRALDSLGRGPARAVLTEVLLDRLEERELATEPGRIADTLRLAGELGPLERKVRLAHLRESLDLEVRQACKESPSRAIRAAEALRQLEGDSPAALELAAKAHTWAGQPSEPLWRQALAAARSPRALDGLALALRRAGRLAEAEPLHQEAADRGPRSQWLLGGLAMAKGDPEEAARRFLAASEGWRARGGWSRLASDHAAEALLLAGRLEEAHNRLRQAREERGWGSWLSMALNCPAGAQDGLLSAMLQPPPWAARLLSLLGTGLLFEGDLGPARVPAHAALMQPTPQRAVSAWRKAVAELAPRPPHDPVREHLTWRLVHALHRAGLYAEADPLWAELDAVSCWRWDAGLV